MTSADQPTCRARRFHRRGITAKGYQHSLDLVDEATQEVLATCDLFGKAALSTVAITDAREETWHMVPGRKVMPTRWMVTNPDRDVVTQFSQNVLGKLVNPLYRVVLTVLDADDRELYRVVDPRDGVFDQLFIGPNSWAVLEDERAVAKVVWLQRPVKADGMFGPLKKLLAVSDLGIVSMGNDHLLPAPAALAMIALVSELTDASIG